MAEEAFGGYVEPPTHLSRGAAQASDGPRPAELRTVPDYDYSLFRYSNIALPFLVLILITAALLAALTFWQGPWGFDSTGFRGTMNTLTARSQGQLLAIPRDFEFLDERPLSNGVTGEKFSDETSRLEGGLPRGLRKLRIASFVIGLVPLILVVFAIRAQPSPGALKGVLLLSAFLFFVVFGTSIASTIYAIVKDHIHQAQECEDFRFSVSSGLQISTSTGSNFLPTTLVVFRGSCDDREQLAIAAVVADLAQCIAAIILAFVLVFTSLQSNWAWGPGRIPVEKSAQRPTVDFLPPSPFTHVASTRRVIVWAAIFGFAAALTLAFVLTIMLYEHRNKPQLIDPITNRQLQIAGWPRKNNRFRAALAGFAVALGFLTTMDLVAWKRRWVSYILGTALFFTAVASFVVFAMDVNLVVKSRGKHLACPTTGATSNVQIRCVQWPYIAVCFLDFALGLIVVIYLIYEYIYRVNFTWDTFYFYADSEWLRNHSLFVEHTDREAYDWKKFTMETGREYFYSPTLGVSTQVQPRNYVPQEGYAPAYVVQQPYLPTPVETQYVSAYPETVQYPSYAPVAEYPQYVESASYVQAPYSSSYVQVPSSSVQIS